MVHAPHHRFTFDEYVRVDAESGIKLEFLDGQVWAMARGTPAHAAITMKIGALLTVALQGKPCRTYSSDLRVRVKATSLGTYPDVTVICGAVDLDPEDPKKHTATNPRVLVEVLSPRAEDYDRGDKLGHYKQIPSVEEVVLVAMIGARSKDDAFTGLENRWRIRLCDTLAYAWAGIALLLLETRLAANSSESQCSE